MRLVHWIVAVCLLTASWDVLGVVNVGGKLRLTQMLAVLVCVAALGRMAQTGRVLWPRGGTALMLWTVAQCLLLPLSGALLPAVELQVLLGANIVIPFAFLQLYGEGNRMEDLMKIYLGSFVCVALFGLVQIGLPAVGGPALFVSQWIVHGRFARISGFNFEPSYFATYMIIGWITLVDLRFSRARIAAGARGLWATYLVGAVLVLSTSKVGWVFMLLEGLLRLLPVMGRFLAAKRAQLRQGKLSVTAPTSRTVLTTLAVALLLGVGLRLLFSVVTPRSFLNGTGIAGTAAHSVNGRTREMDYTWQVFREHPWIGHTMAGVAVEIGAKQGVIVTDTETLHLFWGFPVLFEVLAGSGILFVLPFLAFLYTTTVGAYRFALSRWPEEQAKWLRALARAMIFEWLILFSDQNLARTYLWYHFAMVMTVAYALEYSRVRVGAAVPGLVAEGGMAGGPQAAGAAL